LHNNFHEIKYNTPVNYNNGRIIDLKKVTYKLETVSTELNSTCYTLDVDELSILGDDNLVRIYLMESSKFITNRTILRVAERYVSDNNSITFTASDFKTTAEE